MRTNICHSRSIIFLMVSLLFGACSHPLDDPWLNKNNFHFHGDSFLNCVNCHDLSTECIKCHFDEFGNKSPSDWAHGTIPHSELKDSEVVCNTCHAVNRNYDNGPNDCHDCHDQVKMHVMGGSWLDKNSSDFHGYSSSDCSVCHDLTTRCTECHFDLFGSKSLSNWIHGTIPHSELRDCGAVCNQCHTVDRSYDSGPNACHDCHDPDPGLHESSNRQCTICHPSNLRDAHSDCALCHQSIDTKVQGAIAIGNTICSACHGVSSHRQVHESSNIDCTSCHQSNLQDTHSTCALCHKSNVPAVENAISAGNTNCSACHGVINHESRHDMTMTDTPDCLECHVNNVFTVHVTNQTLSCNVCHESSRQDVFDAITQGRDGETVYCSACHGVSSHRQAHESSNIDCTSCHQSNLQDTHSTCALCHKSNVPAVENAISAGNTDCRDCHSVEGIHGTHYEIVNCTDCHPDILPNL